MARNFQPSGTSQLELKTRIKFWRKYAKRYIPLFIVPFALIIAFLGNLNWPYIAYKCAIIGCLSVCFIYTQRAPKEKRDWGRKVCNLLIGAIFVIIAGLGLKVNLQIEEFVFSLDYLMARHLILDTIYFFIFMKLLAPLAIGRGCCGWGCWISAVLDILPVKTNRVISRKWTYLRYPALIFSFALPAAIIFFRKDSGLLRYTTLDGMDRVLIWFIISNLVYYTLSIAMALIIGKQRAFCKIFCPVGLIMSLPARFSLLKLRPSGANCITCKKCNTVCPMDVEPMAYISAGKPVKSTECIHCFACRTVCPKGAIK
jgi:ferredoxin-type protein NapH